MKRASALAVLAAVTALSGCALAPGLAIDDSRFVSAREPAAPVARPVVTPITPQLIRRQADERTQERTNPAGAREQIGPRYEYRVGAGDVLSITVWEHPELTIPAGQFRDAEMAGHLVNSAGTIFYPHVGVITVGGKTIETVRDELTRGLRAYIRNPQVDVRVVAFRSQRVFVTGEISRPGVLPITDRPMTVLEAVNLSGGGTGEADLHNVLVTRGNQVIPVDVQARYRGEAAGDLVLQHGDQVHIPDRYQNRVFVLGEVQRPSTQFMNKGRLTLADAIGTAEGVSPLTADPSRIYVIRGDLEQPSIYQLDARSADALLLATAFELQPQDVVYVSIAGISRWNRFLAQITPTIQALWQTDTLVRRHR